MYLWSRQLGNRCARCQCTLSRGKSLQKGSRRLASSSRPVYESPLAKILRDSIKATGPISVSRYMQWCLSHPVHGYYAQGDVFGKKGDFITSPEISQIFGELIAIWFVTRWIAAGNPSSSRLVELGPGRGTLLDDILRSFSRLQGVSASLKSIVLVENSDKMREVQEAKLAKECEKKGIKLEWVDSIDDVPPSDEFTMMIAHEFFDAMPINVFKKTSDGLREVVVDLDPQYSPTLPTPSSSTGLRFALSPESTTLSSLLPATSSRFSALPVGARVEIAQDSFKIARKVGELLAGGVKGDTAGPSGAGLIIDYGGETSYGQSFRAFRDHKLVDVFDGPGTADLTANVDFAYLKEALHGTGTRPLGTIPQAQLLLSLGLQPRLNKLMSSATTPERQEDLRKGAQRLIDPVGMGSQYQVMGLVSGVPEDEVYPFPKV